MSNWGGANTDEVHDDDNNLQKKTISNLLDTSHNFLALRILCSCEAVFQAALGLIASNGFTTAAETAGERFYSILAQTWPQKQSQSS